VPIKLSTKQLQPNALVVICKEDYCQCVLNMGGFIIQPDPFACEGVQTLTFENKEFFTVNTAIGYSFREYIFEIKLVSETLVKLHLVH